METNRLRQLCAVVETGSLREAARLLHLSHSGLSKSMKALEDELQVKLFLPSGRGIVITDAGRRVYGAAQKIVAEVETIHGAAKGALPASQPIRIATFEVFSTYFMGELVAALAGQRVVVRERIPGAIEDSVAAGETDLGITYIAMPRPDLDYLRVTSLEMAIFGRVDRFGDTPLEELPFCAPQIPLRSVASPTRGLDGWPDDRLPRTVVHSIDMLETALDFARRGLGVLYAPSFVVALHNRQVKAAHRLDRLPLPKILTDPKERARTVWIVKRRSTEEDAVVRRIGKVLREVCRLDGSAAPGPAA
jgi:DNA-binding transcriptional LysR family regulator